MVSYLTTLDLWFNNMLEQVQEIKVRKGPRAKRWLSP